MYSYCKSYNILQFLDRYYIKGMVWSISPKVQTEPWKEKTWHKEVSSSIHLESLDAVTTLIHYSIFFSRLLQFFRKTDWSTSWNLGLQSDFYDIKEKFLRSWEIAQVGEHMPVLCKALSWTIFITKSITETSATHHKAIINDEWL